MNSNFLWFMALILSNFLWYQFFASFRDAVLLRWRRIRTIMTPEQMERLNDMEDDDDA